MSEPTEPTEPNAPNAVDTTYHRVTMADLSKLLGGEGGVDLAPVYEGGKQVAMKIIGLQPGTIAARLGGHNDDTIESINDQPMTSVAGGYAAADRAIATGRITIRGKRAGVPYVTILVLPSGSQ